MPEPVTVRVLFFASLRDAIGESERSVPLAPEAATSDALWDVLEAQHPEIARFRSMTRLAVNQRYVRGDVPLEEGDEVALITPVSGG